MASAPSPPPTPNPYAVASVQQQANVSVAIANSFMSNANVVSPQGSSTFSQTGTYSLSDPQYDSAGALVGTTTRSIPIFTQTVSLSTIGQSIYDANQTLQLDINNLGVSQVTKTSNILSTSFDLSGLPPTASGPAAQTLNDVILRPSNAILYNVGTADTSADRASVTAAMLSRATTTFNIQRNARITALANMGIFPGMEAYNNEMEIFDFQLTDAAFQADLAGGQEQTRQFQIQLQQGDFYNRAQEQDFRQLTLIIDFANSVALKRFAMLTNVADFINTFRERILQEELTQRNQSLNELSTMLRGGQLAVPAFTGFKPGHIDSTPVAESVYRSANLDYQRYEAKVSQQNALIGGIAGIAGGVAGLGTGDGRTVGGNLLSKLPGLGN